MAVYSYNYGNSAELYKTNLYGGADADIDNTGPVNGSDGYTSNINLTVKLFSTIDFTFTGNNATDDLIIELFRSTVSTWNGNEIAVDSFQISNPGVEAVYSYVIGPSHGPGYYRFSMQSAGATTLFDMDVMQRRTDYVSV
ncbi:MAG: hypothetical protein GXP10_07855 [Gammaproteobacteria bacterium]|nr:hypothetical protein [Gammaproteobacteria bacterium]